MAGSAESIPTSLCRKCLGSTLAVSKVAQITAPASTLNGNRGSPDLPSPSGSSTAAMMVVIVAGLLALAAMMVIVVLLRRKRIREAQMRSNGSEGAATDVVVDAAKGVNGGEQRSGVRKWSAEAVELVVMAGESTPTFLAHPAPAPNEHVPVVECPPFSSGGGATGLNGLPWDPRSRFRLCFSTKPWQVQINGASA